MLVSVRVSQQSINHHQLLTPFSFRNPNEITPSENQGAEPNNQRAGDNKEVELEN
jgi:hypothetical protein